MQPHDSWGGRLGFPGQRAPLEKRLSMSARWPFMAACVGRAFWPVIHTFCAVTPDCLAPVNVAPLAVADVMDLPLRPTRDAMSLLVVASMASLAPLGVSSSRSPRSLTTLSEADRTMSAARKRLSLRTSARTASSSR